MGADSSASAEMTLTDAGSNIGLASMACSRQIISRADNGRASRSSPKSDRPGRRKRIDADTPSGDEMGSDVLKVIGAFTRAHLKYHRQRYCVCNWLTECRRVPVPVERGLSSIAKIASASCQDKSSDNLPTRLPRMPPCRAIFGMSRSISRKSA